MKTTHTCAGNVYFLIVKNFRESHEIYPLGNWINPPVTFLPVPGLSNREYSQSDERVAILNSPKTMRDHEIKIFKMIYSSCIHSGTRK